MSRTFSTLPAQRCPAQPFSGGTTACSGTLSSVSDSLRYTRRGRASTRSRHRPSPGGYRMSSFQSPSSHLDVLALAGRQAGDVFLQEGVALSAALVQGLVVALVDL